MNTKMLYIAFVALVISPCLSAQERRGLPNPAPFAEILEVARQNPIIHTSNSSWRDYSKNISVTAPRASFIVGNKELRVAKDGITSPYTISLFSGEKKTGVVLFYGAAGVGNSGYPFKDIEEAPSRLEVNKELQTITLFKPYLTKGGEKAEFSYTLRSLGDSKIEVSWDMGKISEANSVPKVSPWLSLEKIYREHKIVIGKEVFGPSVKEKLLKSENQKITSRHTSVFIFAKNNAELNYSINFGDASGQLEEVYRYSKNRGDLYYITYRPSIKSNSLIIDLGSAALAGKDTPPPVGGIDFYKNDGTHIPKSPVTNLFFNPTFNQGLRFWNWTGGGARYEPSTTLRYDIEEEGLFHKNAMVINPTQSRSAPLKSFPIPLNKGKTYTLSFFGKTSGSAGTISVGLCSAAEAGKFRGKYGVLYGDLGTPSSRFPVDNSWKRFSRTFVADEYGLMLLATGSGNKKLFIDGIQLEEGNKATEFITAPLEGILTTANPDNDLVKGEDIDGKILFVGKPGTAGTVNITVQNCYREIVDSFNFTVTIPESGIHKIPLPLNPEKLGEGVFVVRADYLVDGYKAYTDYRRLSIMTPLTNTHATKNIFGTITEDMGRICRGDDLGKKFMDWGFGSCSWGISADPYDQTFRANMEKKYNISNFFTPTRLNGKNYSKYAELNNFKKWKKVTPEIITLAEESAYEKVKLYDSAQYSTWCFGNEEESHYLPSKKPDEYMKVIAAAQRGAKRADPNIKFFLTNGTSGYSLLRGFHPMEGYFKSAQKMGLRFDAVATHPYGSIDGGRLSRVDLDEETARLIDQMKRYGYGPETPIYFTEGGNIAMLHAPEWNTASRDRFPNGLAGYDFGYKEFLAAASTARYWIISLKYWPQVQSTNIWFPRPFLDYHFTPYILNKVTNTLGHHMDDVKHVADIKPNGKIRGYTFSNSDGEGLAWIWCIDNDVEWGLRRGPMVKVTFDQDVTFYDLMGNPRYAEPHSDGFYDIPLTPAPLLIKAKDVKKLNQALQNLETNDTRSNFTVQFMPSSDGKMQARVKNMTNRMQEGVLEIGQKKVNYQIKPEADAVLDVEELQEGVQFGKMHRWNNTYTLIPRNGEVLSDEWKSDYVYVQKTNGMPQWDTIKGVNFDNVYLSQKVKEKIAKGEAVVSNKVSAQFKMAWDEKNLYLRVEAKDDDFIVSKDFWDKTPNSETMLYHHDGCLEVYFDTGANGRHTKAYDTDDYRFDFSIGKGGTSGPGAAYRLREVDPQLADGINMPSKKEASENIVCDFQRTKDGYAYTIVFGLRYIEPIALHEGFISGFSLYLHDKQSGDAWPKQGLTTATQKGKHSDYNPHLWPLMILVD